MKSALSDFILGKKGIYGILHIIILVMSLFLVISISVDTFKGIPFYTQSSYMKTQLWICIWFLFDFVLEFFLAKHKGRYLRTHFIFLLVAIPYQNIIAPAFVWFSDILIGLPDNLIQAIAAVWLVVMSIFVPAVVERVIDGF